MKRIILTAVLFLFLGIPSAYASHYDLLDIDLVPESITMQLVSNKIENTEQLFAILMKKKERAEFSKKYGMPAKEVDELAHKLELMQIVGVGPKAAELLRLSGITSLKALTEANETELLDNLQRVNREKNITGVQPDMVVVHDWIEKSKKIVHHME